MLILPRRSSIQVHTQYVSLQYPRIFQTDLGSLDPSYRENLMEQTFWCFSTSDDLPEKCQAAWFKRSEVAQSCMTHCDSFDCSQPGSFVHGILQARVVEWAALSFSRGTSWPGYLTQVSHMAGRCFPLWATRDAHLIFWKVNYFKKWF